MVADVIGGTRELVLAPGDVKAIVQSWAASVHNTHVIRTSFCLKPRRWLMRLISAIQEVEIVAYCESCEVGLMRVTLRIYR